MRMDEVFVLSQFEHQSFEPLASIEIQTHGTLTTVKETL